MSYLPRISAITLAVSLLAGCGETKYIPTSAPFCKAVAPVCISKDDVLTEDTATQVEANNLGMTKVCKVRKNMCKS